MRASGSSRPLVGLTVCGDDFLVLEESESLLLAVLDGLGHGEESALASRRAREILLAAPPHLELPSLMERCHLALRSTRGAAIGLARLQADGAGSFCGIGNIEVRTVVGKPPSVFCLPGIVGHNVRRVREMPFSVAAGEIHCMVSDGIITRASLESCLPGPLDQLANRIVARCARDHDDATALVFSLSEPV